MVEKRPELIAPLRHFDRTWIKARRNKAGFFCFKYSGKFYGQKNAAVS
jgi:hypothetical protein